MNAAIVKYGESVVERPIVIEGYSNIGEPEDPLSSSRHRAILVRRYLWNHFQLDEEMLGVVSMKTPATGTPSAPWDGVCVVVLNGHQ